MAATCTEQEWQNAKEQVSSWIENEGRCVTAQRIHQATNLSRREASGLLDEVLTENGNQKFQMTICEQVVENNTTVFRLRNSTLRSEKEEKNPTVFAVASLSATESVTAAHERDMVDWRERVEDGRYRQQGGDASAIVVAEQVDSMKDREATGKGFVPDSQAGPAPTKAPIQNQKFAGKAKATTAAAFFSKNQSKGTTSTKKPLATSSAPPNKITASSTTSSKAPQPTRAKENEVRKNQTKPKGKVGTVDDFVGDEEESDDEETILKERKKQEAVDARRKAVDEANRQSTQEQEEKKAAKDSQPTVHGAMDSFATKTKPKVTEAANGELPKGRQKKRRKKLVESTTMVNGYLRTETQIVWEDVPTDEEEEEKQRAIAKKKTNAARKPTASGGNPQAMKQKSLMGFFAKK